MVVSLLKATALRSKYLTHASYQRATAENRKAVVISATSGIGQACARRLAEQGYTVLAVARDKPGRAQTVLEDLTQKSKQALDDNGAGGGRTIPKHEFYPCDAFSLPDVKRAAEKIIQDHPVIDAVVLTQGMATTQGFTPTKEGNDEKLTLHYFSRLAMAHGLLPSLAKSTLPKGPVVISVLSGGIHSAYSKYQQDFSLEKNYSIQNAADAAGFYNDLGLDQMALDHPKVNFVHASPGFVNTNWGTEFNFILRSIVRCMQPLGKKASDCAEYMMGPTIFASDAGDDLPPKRVDREKGVIVMGESGESKVATKEHTDDAREFVWKQTVGVMKKAGINF